MITMFFKGEPTNMEIAKDIMKNLSFIGVAIATLVNSYAIWQLSKAFEIHTKVILELQKQVACEPEVIEKGM